MRSSHTMSAVPLAATPRAVLAAHQPSLAPRFTSPGTRLLPAPSAPADATSAFCRYCKKRRHLRDQCSKLLRRQHRPPAPVLSAPPRAAVVESSGPESSASFTTRMDQLAEQLQVLQRAFQTGSPSVMFAAFGMTSSWILDSGATHHMTFDATQLVDLRPTHLTSRVRTADGTLLSVTQSGRLTSTSTPLLYCPT